MNSLVRFLRFFRHGDTPTPQQFSENHDPENILHDEVQRLRTIDPETSRRWQFLKIALEKEPTPGYARGTTGRIHFPRVAVSFAVGAAVLIAVGVVWLGKPSTISYETHKGQVSTITLADSSEVTLNHTSEVTISRGSFEKVRRVGLKGEAYFRVRETGIPFVVSTEVAAVRVLGTEFNVRVRGSEMEVAVLRGMVRVSVQDNDRDSAVTLIAGQVAHCVKGGLPGTPAPLLFVDYPGWMHGKLLFQRSSFLSVCSEIESKFDVVLRIEDPRLREVTITGAVDSRSVEAALLTLTQLTGNKYRYEKSSYTIY